MQEIHYKFNKHKFKKYTNAYCAQNLEWKKKNLIATLLFVLAAAVTAGPAIAYGTDDLAGFLAVLTTGFLFGLIVWPIGYAAKKRAARKFGNSYDTMSRMFLLSNVSITRKLFSPILKTIMSK